MDVLTLEYQISHLNKVLSVLSHFYENKHGLYISHGYSDVYIDVELEEVKKFIRSLEKRISKMLIQYEKALVIAKAVDRAKKIIEQ